LGTTAPLGNISVVAEAFNGMMQLDKDAVQAQLFDGLNGTYSHN